ncbi:MAG: LCP family protein [Ruminococcus sp.]|nr:LCP family protein [Ruminococcus sp.]
MDKEKEVFVQGAEPQPVRKAVEDSSSEHHHHHHHHSEHHHHSGHHHSSHGKKKKKMSAAKKSLILILIVIFLALVAIGIVLLIFHHYIALMNIVPVNKKYEIYDTITDDDLTNQPDSPKDKIDDLEKNNRDAMENGIMKDKDVLNVLLIGTDGRTEDERGRSDSMILFSINKKTEKIIMTSFMRDIYLEIPNIESTRLNHAYAYGGPPLLVETIEHNFRIKIDRWAQINFASFERTIDKIGGVEINVMPDEVPYISGVDHSGKQLLNGKQALAYSRIRVIGTDFKRTQRQRNVLEKIVQKAKGMSLSELDDLMEAVLPEVTTNMQESEILDLLWDSRELLSYERVQCRVPKNDSWEYLTIRQMSVLGIDFDDNIRYLWQNIYNRIE